MISKVAAARTNPREMLLLKKSLQAILPLKEVPGKKEVLKKMGSQLTGCDFLLQKIENEWQEEAPWLIRQKSLFSLANPIEMLR